MNWFFDINNVWAVPVYPLIAFLLIVLTRSLFRDTNSPLANKHLSMVLTVGATFLGLLHSVGVLNWAMEQHGHGHLERNVAWLEAGNFRFSLGYLLDNMTAMMLFVVTFISLFIQIYTHGYMNHDKGYAKFFGYLALFNFSMLGLVLSTNLFQMYIFWELVGVSSYLLIGFWFHKPSAGAAAIKAFLMNRVGDFGFLVGILALLFFSFQTTGWSWSEYLAADSNHAMLSFASLGEFAELLSAHLNGGWAYATICILIFMGPMAKSAQVPLHTWLPDAMEGPTPISALIHAATMVAAGVYLIGRVYPLFAISDIAMGFVLTIGVATALIGATIALTQTDIKKALAYSTMSQLGYMVAAMGCGAFTAALFHLFTHAFFKALLFLCSARVIHACEDEQDMRKMGGLKSKLPITHLSYLIGTLAISGFPLTSGFFSKDLILEGAEHSTMVNIAGVEFSLPFMILAFTAGMTAFYMFRTYFLTFWGEYRGEAHVHAEDTAMKIPLAVLAVPALGIGYLLSGLVPNMPVFAEYITYGAHGGHHPDSILGFLTAPVAIQSTFIGLTGIFVAYLFYATEQFKNVPKRLSENLLPDMYQLFSNKWYFDEMYQKFVDDVYLVFARASSWFDRAGIDGVANGTGFTVRDSGVALKQLQSGRLQAYIAILFFGLVCLALLMFFGIL